MNTSSFSLFLNIYHLVKMYIPHVFSSMQASAFLASFRTRLLFSCEMAVSLSKFQTTPTLMVYCVKLNCRAENGEFEMLRDYTVMDICDKTNELPDCFFIENKCCEFKP